MLPATKAVPKAMLPLLDKPMIQHAVEECRAADIEEVIIITGFGKSVIEDHFTADPAFEILLSQGGRHKTVEAMGPLSRFPRLRFVCQDQPMGLGHAVSCAHSLVGREPFALLLPDVFLLGPRPAISQLIEARAESRASVVAVESVPPERVSQCGIVAVEPSASSGRMLRVRGVVEKPAPSEAPSDLAIMGRYVLEPEIFDCLERTTPGLGNEIQLSDALTMLARDSDLRALLCEGKAFDAGDRNGFFQLSVELALRDPELGDWLRRRLGFSTEPPFPSSY